MGLVAVKCPKTGKAVKIGVILDKKQFDALEMSNSILSPCPHCGGKHAFSKKDAPFKENSPENPLY
jgi:endogenous inhibitor of DNA gyrase (YacG/DUF329 family)